MKIRFHVALSIAYTYFLSNRRVVTGDSGQNTCSDVITYVILRDVTELIFLLPCCPFV